MIKAIAIDDEPPALKVLQNYCRKYENIELVNCFSQPVSGLDYLAGNSVDLVFLDIQMPGTNGLEIARRIKPETVIVFTTAFEEHALEGYNLNAIDYLLKPFSYARFCQAMNKVLKFVSNETATPRNNYITVRSDYSLVRIPVSDIFYLEAMDDYVKFFLDNTVKPVVVRSTLKSVIDMLPAGFLRVHRSFVLNKEKISGARKGFVLIGEKAIPIGEKFSNDVAEFMKSGQG